MFCLFLGKSAFIHTLMLSAGYYYAPDELQFYLVDFKDAKSSPEFANYIQKRKGKNMFIPHIRYLSIKSKCESAFSSFCDSLNSTYDEVQNIISKADMAYCLGKKAFFHLALNNHNNSSNCSSLTITNIDCLSNTSEALRRREREISSEGQNMMRNASRINEMMQSELMRKSYAIVNELYSFNLERVSGCLSSAYSCLREYQRVI